MGASLRGALVGYGFIASQGHSPLYQRLVDTEITAISDVSAARREAASRDFPTARVYEGYAELIEREGHRLDFVDIAVPPYAHAEVARRALSRGLHVLCEKPLAVCAREAWSMAEDAIRARRVLFPCHTYRHAPVIAEVRSRLSAGAVGAVRLVTMQTFRPTHARGVPEWRPDWRRERRIAGGGIAMDHGPHSFYLAFEWMRSFPLSITAKHCTMDSHDTEDNFTCTLTFPNGLATVQLTWTGGVRKVLYTIHGARGVITVDDDVVRAHQIDGSVPHEPTPRLTSSRWTDASHQDWFGDLFADFRRAIVHGEFVGPRTVDAINCVQTIEAAYESAARGSREVRLSCFVPRVA